MPHSFKIRVYYEDTDLAGIVYYANYLKFIERARTEWLREKGVDQSGFKDRFGIVFAVRRIEADYLAPARFGDDLVVETCLSSHSGARVALVQEVLRARETLFTAKVTLVALVEGGRAVRFPAGVRRCLDS